MAIDYQSHPSKLSEAGDINGVTVQRLKSSIPPHCFKPLYRWAFWYIFRDLAMAASVMAVAHLYIPRIENYVLRYCAWIMYGYLEGFIMTGIWVLGHECGHSALSPSDILNHTAGFFFHSILLTPYFSWRSTHRRHHIYANNLAKDQNYVPPARHEYASRLSSSLNKVHEFMEDAPLYTLSRIVLQQLLGWPWYLLTSITAAQGCLAKPRSNKLLGNSHFMPFSSLFRPEEWLLIILSDIGIGLMVVALWYASKMYGFATVLLLYGQPYMWVNHWIVAITYLHHTHPDVPKYEQEAWTFIKGATATIDREIGWGAKVLMHNVAEYHVVHHIFPRMPFYYGEEATKAIRPLLGEHYHEERRRSYWASLWESFTQCQYVEPDDPHLDPKSRTMRYRPGPSPPPVTVIM